MWVLRGDSATVETGREINARAERVHPRLGKFVDGVLALVDAVWIVSYGSASRWHLIGLSGEMMRTHGKSRFAFARAAAALLAGSTILASTPTLAEDATAATSSMQPGAVHLGNWGFDLTGRDTSVKPGDDFERYASGNWLTRTAIPADKPSTGSFYDVYDLSQDQLKVLVTSASANSKYGALYQSMMDEARVEALGIEPLKPDLATVAAIRTKADFASHMGTTNGRFGSSLFDWILVPDTADASMNALNIVQAGIGMPDRDYYLTDQFKPQREAYRAYIERTFKAIGIANPAAAADRVMAFETEIAKKSWPAADRRDIDKTNNPMSTAQLENYAPEFPWAAFFAGAKVPPQKRMIVNEKSAIRDLAAIYAKTPLQTLKEWEAFHTANQASPYLNKAMVDSRFDYTKTITGVTEIRPRWKRALSLVDGSLGDLIGQEYVARYFPPSSKAKMVDLVSNLKVAMADRIKGNNWMSGPTKAAALDKLAKMDVQVGYPDKFRDYSKLEIKADDLYGNVQRSGEFNAAYAMEDLGKPVDHKKWEMNPQTVNAYNGGGENKIVFPAGILQPPFFDPSADDAVNYGAVGAVIGHEISHGFDDQGRKYDASGSVKDWWTAEDNKRFEAEAKIFGDQYAKFEAVPGTFLNPTLTMGENIADFAGIQVALDAYHRSLDGKEAPVLDGLTGDQRFFLAYAQIWREKQREDAMRSQVTTDPHSPGRFRVLGPVRNVEAWYKAFGITPQSSMYIPPEKRARIW